MTVMENRQSRATWLPYGRQWIDESDIEAVADVLRGDYITAGPLVPEFESAIANYVGSKYAVAFANGTAALHAACYAAGIGDGDEVITTPITFVATANCILYQGATPVFADIDKHTYNIDPLSIESLITDRTKAIIPVDFTGQPASLAAIHELADRYGLIVIEDAAHALGATYGSQKVGSISHMTMFSLHPVKHITAGEGGVITTDSEVFYHRLLAFRNHGIVRDPALLKRAAPGAWYYEMQSLGYNYRLTDIAAALALSQLGKLDRFVERRREIAEAYNQAFKDMDAITIPYQDHVGRSSWHLYVIRLQLEQSGEERAREERAIRRNGIFDRLRQHHIGVNLHYIPVYLQPYYQRLGYQAGLCPQAERLYDSMLTLPLYPAMTDEDIVDVIDAVRRTIGN